MTDIENKLKSILGEDFFDEITTKDVADGQDSSDSEITNSKKIFCECNTLILRPSTAKLIPSSDSMKDAEKHLKFLQSSDKCFKNLTRGCYWLVDDMYKFEQIGYSKEIVFGQQQQPIENATKKEDDLESSHLSTQKSDNTQQPEPQSSSSAPKRLRYLFCAECDLCPLGWHDDKIKESYLYVW